MQTVFDMDELCDACMVLFGPDIVVSAGFLSGLKPETVKSAYRKNVLATHPDRALVVGKDPGRMGAEFIRATMAYRKLYALAAGRKDPPAATRPSDRSFHRPAPKAPPSGRRPGRFYAGKLPRGHLPICRFLYYAGKVSWNEYINALVWQRRSRPCIGRMLGDMGVLTAQQVRRVLGRRRMGEKFGETALRLGCLSPLVLSAVLLRQRRLQPLIGEYFVGAGILTRRQMREFAMRQWMHNGGSCPGGRGTDAG